MVLILTLAFAMAVVTSESNPTLFGIDNLISFTFLTLAIAGPSFLFLRKCRRIPRPVLPVGRGGAECNDFKTPIGRTFLSGNCIFAETGKSRLSVKPPHTGG